MAPLSISWLVWTWKLVKFVQNSIFYRSKWSKPSSIWSKQTLISKILKFCENLTNIFFFRIFFFDSWVWNTEKTGHEISKSSFFQKNLKIDFLKKNLIFRVGALSLPYFTRRNQKKNSKKIFFLVKISQDFSILLISACLDHIELGFDHLDR